MAGERKGKREEGPKASKEKEEREEEEGVGSWAG